MLHLYRSTTNKQVCKTVFLTSFTDYNVNVIIDSLNIYIYIGIIIRAMSNIHNQGYKKCIWYWINKSNKLSLLFQDVVLPTWYGNFGTAHGPGVSNQFRLIDFKRVGVGEIRRHTVQCRANTVLSNSADSSNAISQTIAERTRSLVAIDRI